MSKFKKEYEILKNHYSLLDIKKISQFTSANINSDTFLIQTNKNKFILKFVPNKNPQLNKMCEIVSFCKQQNVPVQEPIKNISDKFVVKNYYFLTKYYSGNYFDGTNSELSDFAKNLALLHNALSKIRINYNFESFREYYKILKNTELLKIKNIIDEKGKKITTYDKMFLDHFVSLQNSFSNITVSGEYIESKKQLIHFDLHPENVIFKNFHVNAIIDFGSMRKGHLIDDVAFSSFRFAYYKTKNLNKIINQMKYFYNAYTKFNQLPDLLPVLPQITKLQILKRLSLILRNYYFTNTSFWISDMEKQLKFLSIIEKIINKWNKI
ncbi:phosphotransferase [Candidatus Nitrosopelagicus sp.]|nr:phosphotransferase [Candidatus Nitrosopelagicus sp.]